ncbi:MAG: hypothetical protein R3F35_11290 [Myxococcota bacterium]
MSNGPQSSPRPGPRRDRRRGRARWRSAGLAGLLSVALGFGCDRNIEPYEPGEEPREPDLTRIFPGSPSGPASGIAAGGEAGAGAARGAFPPSRTEGDGSVADAMPAPASPGARGGEAAGGAAPISGRIELPAALEAQQPAGAVLFVIARPQGQAGGPPLAVLRIPDPSFPLDFEIGPGDVMIPSMRFAGPISLTARLDADGNAMTRGASDLASEEASPLEPGATDVRLVLGRSR